MAATSLVHCSALVLRPNCLSFTSHKSPQAMLSVSNRQHLRASGRRCGGRVDRARRRATEAMAPDEEKMTRRSPLDFPVEWDRPSPGRRPDIFPQFSPMKTPLPPPLPTDPPEEDEDEEEKKEEDPEKEPDKPEE